MNLSDIRTAFLTAFGFGDYQPMGIASLQSRDSEGETETERLKRTAEDFRRIADGMSVPKERAFENTLEQIARDL
ncbi:MAG: hypothetical protein WA908_01430 [Pontixanthobacter sp.]